MLIFIGSGVNKPTPNVFISYNEEDTMRKLGMIKVILDPISGEVKYLKELNLLGCWEKESKNHKTRAPTIKSKRKVYNFCYKLNFQL